MASSRERADRARDATPAASRRSTCRKLGRPVSSGAGATSSAASLGVSARTSAARSESVTSISCPTAEMTGNPRGGDRPHHRLLVERPEVLHAAAAAGDDQAVDRPASRRLTVSMAAAISAAAPSPCTRTGTTSTSAPRQRRAEHLEKIADGRPGRAGDHGDPPHERRQRPFSRRVEQSFPGQLLAKLPQGQLQRPHAARHDVLDDQLVAAAGGVEVEMAAADHLQAVVQVEAQSRRPRRATSRPAVGPDRP